MPEPATRSLTVLETSTSPGAASEAMRAPVCTAIPATFPSTSSHSPGVQSGPHLESELAHRLDDGAGTPDRPCRPVETGEEAIACGVHLPAAEARELAAHDRMVVLEQLTPGAIAERGSTLTRADNVGEKHGREDALRFGLLPSPSLPDPGQEPLDLSDDRFAVSHPGKVISPGELDVDGRLGSGLPQPARSLTSQLRSPTR